jgi:hypothetical protein
MRLGGNLSLILNPRYPKFVKVLKKRPFHVLPAVNTLFNALLNNPEFRQLDFAVVHLPGRRHGGVEGTASVAADHGLRRLKAGA